MAQEDASDIFMIFKKGQEQLEGECTTELKIKGRTNDLLNDFRPGAMFEISKFDFGVGANQEVAEDFQHPGFKTIEAAVAAQAAQVAELGRAAIPNRNFPAYKPSKTPLVKLRRDTKSNQTTDGNPVTIQPISFSRKMDRASPVLLSHMIDRTYFTRVAIVKRKSAGGVAAGDAYLRMDFEGVILIEANWSNEDPVTEDYSFHARAITMRYKPQLPDGTLGASRVGCWSMKLKPSEAPL